MSGDHLTEEDKVASLVKQSSDDTIRTGVGRHGWKYSDELYNRRWLARIRAKSIVDANGCHLWQGATQEKGYGSTTYRGKTIKIHRMIFRLLVRDDLTRLDFVCHSCDVKRCWNPDHLWLGDNGLNKKDETAKGTNFWANRTHCPRGHEYTPENIHLYESKPGVMSRGCKLCSRVRNRLKAGWPEDLAMELDKVPPGYSRGDVR